MEMDSIEIFCYVDDFCKGFDGWYESQLLSVYKPSRKRKGRLSLSEIITILILYHRSGKSCFKYYYQELCLNQRFDFPNLVHYARFVKLIKKAFPAIVCLLKSMEGEITEYLIIDSTIMSVCHNLRSKRHKVFQDFAEKGKTSTGWFFGMKLHMIFNTKGEIVRVCITPGNTDDRKPVPDLVKGITSKLIGDKGYISKKLFNQLFEQGVTMITKIKKRMKNILMDTADKLMLMKRSFVETIFSSMKSLGTLIHHRHRCHVNAFTHLFAGLISYQLRKDKPSLSEILKLNP